MPPGLRQVDVDRDLTQPALDHKRFQKIRMLEQSLAVRHQHRHQPGAHGVARNLDQFFRPPGAPIGIGHVATGDLQTAARPLEAAIGVDLLLHLRERRDRDLVRVCRQVAMRATKRAVARAGCESAVGEMTAGELVRRAQFLREGIPPRLQKRLLLEVDRKTKSLPAGSPRRGFPRDGSGSGRRHYWILSQDKAFYSREYQ